MRWPARRRLHLEPHRARHHRAVASPPTCSRSATSGRPVLTWSASTDNVGVAGYIVYRSTNGTQGAEVARTTAGVRTWTDTSFQEKVKYTYSVQGV